MHGNLICDALERRRLLRFRYRDHVGATTVEPYVYGANTAGHLVLSAWLVSGATHDAGPERWRLYLDSEMRAVEMLPDEFHANRPDYKPNDARFRLIRCQVRPRPAHEE